MAKRQASGDPGRQNTSRPWYTPAAAPDNMAALPIFSYDRKRNSSPNPGSVRSNVGSSVGIVTSRFPIPVPPFVTIASQVHDACSTASRIGFDSSFTTTEKRMEWPARWKISRINLPDSSVSGVRLSEIVMTPHFTDAGACSLCFLGTAMVRIAEKTEARLKVPVQLTLNKVNLESSGEKVSMAYIARPRNGATRFPAAGSSSEATNAGKESKGLARTMRAARFAPIPGRAEIAASGARFTSSGYSTAVRERCPWLTTRTSTNRLMPVVYGKPTRIG